MPGRSDRSTAGRVYVVAGVVLVLAAAGFMALTGAPLRALRREVWLPFISAAAGGSPSLAAVVTMGLFVVPTAVLTVLVALRLGRKPRRRTTVIRAALSMVALLPAVTMLSWRRPSGTGRLYAEYAAGLGNKELTDAVTYGVLWGGRALLLWLALGMGCLVVGAWRSRRGLSARGYGVVVGTGMATFWAVVLPVVGHRAATVPLSEPWAIQPWLG